MSIRDRPIYLSTEVWRALWLLARTADSMTGRNGAETPDGIADRMLHQAIKEQHPQLFEHQSRIDRLEKELIASLSKKAGEASTESRQQK